MTNNELLPFDTITTPKKKTPSVTQVLKLLSDQYYKNIDRREMIRKGKIGTAVHKLIAQDVKDGLTYDQIDVVLRENADVLRYFKSFLLFKIRKTTFGSWRFVCSEIKLQNERFNGTIDLICEKDGEYWVIDVKTTDEIKLFNRLQVAAYAILLRDSGLVPKEAKIRRAILNLKQDGDFEFLEFDDEQDMARWTELLNIYEFNKANGG